MTRDDRSVREIVVEQTKATGVLPCIKLNTGRLRRLRPGHVRRRGPGDRGDDDDARGPGGDRGHRRCISQGRLWVGAGTVLDPATAREVILHGGSLIVNPAVIPEVIDMANRYRVPVYSGAFTATECLQAMRAGAAMVKIFPAELGGPKYMTNLRMVFPR